MDRYIARLNIEHFHQKLVEESDETRRQMLLRLLADEQTKLAVSDPPADAPKGKKKQS